MRGRQAVRTRCLFREPSRRRPRARGFRGRTPSVTSVSALPAVWTPRLSEVCTSGHCSETTKPSREGRRSLCGPSAFRWLRAGVFSRASTRRLRHCCASRDPRGQVESAWVCRLDPLRKEGCWVSSEPCKSFIHVQMCTPHATKCTYLTCTVR